MSMPCSIRSRASVPNRISLAAMTVSLSARPCSGGAGFDNTHDVGFLHDHEVLAIELDLGARPLSEQHTVAALDVEWVQLAILIAHAGANSDDFALHRLFLRRVRDEDAASGFRLRRDTAD